MRRLTSPLPVHFPGRDEAKPASSYLTFTRARERGCGVGERLLGWAGGSIPSPFLHHPLPVCAPSTRARAGTADGTCNKLVVGGRREPQGGRSRAGSWIWIPRSGGLALGAGYLQACVGSASGARAAQHVGVAGVLQIASRGCGKLS